MQKWVVAKNRKCYYACPLKYSGLKKHVTKYKGHVSKMSKRQTQAVTLYEQIEIRFTLLLPKSVMAKEINAFAESKKVRLGYCRVNLQNAFIR